VVQLLQLLGRRRRQGLTAPRRARGEEPTTGAYGQIGVLPDHAALVTALEPGPLSYTADGRTTRMEIGGGFAEVRDNVMTVLADSAEVQP